jgi:hypothetical protein
MASESAGSTVWVMDLHRSKNYVCVATVNDMTVADFKKRVMFSDDVVEENRWSTRDPGDATLLREDGKTPVDTRLLLSSYADPGTNTVSFVLEPPPVSTSAAVGTGAPSAAVCGAEFPREGAASLQSPRSAARSTRSPRNGFSSISDAVALDVCTDRGLEFMYTSPACLDSLEPTLSPTVPDVDTSYIWRAGEVPGYGDANSKLLSLLNPYVARTIADFSLPQNLVLYSGEVPVLLKCRKQRQLRIHTFDGEYTGAADFCLVFNHPISSFADPYKPAEIVIDYETTAAYGAIDWKAQMLMECTALWERGGKHALIVTDLQHATMALIDADSHNIVRIPLANTSLIIRAMALLAKPNFQVHAAYRHFFFPEEAGACPPAAKKARKHEDDRVPGANIPPRSGSKAPQPTRSSGPAVTLAPTAATGRKP